MLRTKAASLKCVFFILFVCLLAIDSTRAALQEIKGNDIDSFVTSNTFVLILFKSSSDCPECEASAGQVEELPQPELLNTAIEKRFTTDHKTGEKYGVKDFPAVVFFRNGIPALFDGQKIEVGDLYAWLEIAFDVATKELYDDSFEHLTQASTGATTGDWFVLFYKPDCEACQHVLPAFESAGIRVRHKMNFAKVDFVKNKKLTERFKISDCPTAIYFRQGKMYLYEPRKFDPRSLVSFVESWYTNVKAQHVPREPTAFDILTESIALYIKEQVNNPDRKWMFFASAVAIATVVIAIVALVCCKTSEKDRRKLE